MEHMTRGYDPGVKGILRTLGYVTFQELATRVSHRNTGKACDDPVAEQLLARIAMDENMHMVFYRNLAGAAMDAAPDEMMRATTTEVKKFQMPGSDLTDFGRRAMLIANADIYTPTQHKEEVLEPVLKHWRVFDRTDFSAEGEQAREELAAYLAELAVTSERFEERQTKRREAANARAE